MPARRLTVETADQVTMADMSGITDRKDLLEAGLDQLVAIHNHRLSKIPGERTSFPAGTSLGRVQCYPGNEGDPYAKAWAREVHQSRTNDLAAYLQRRLYEFRQELARPHLQGRSSVAPLVTAVHFDQVLHIWIPTIKSAAITITRTSAQAE